MGPPYHINFMILAMGVPANFSKNSSRKTSKQTFSSISWASDGVEYSTSEKEYRKKLRVQVLMYEYFFPLKIGEDQKKKRSVCPQMSCFH